MCSHKKQVVLATTSYCELIEEFGMEACPKKLRVPCLANMNPSPAKNVAVENQEWFAQMETLLN
jgi:hypothetical protein